MIKIIDTVEGIKKKKNIKFLGNLHKLYHPMVQQLIR